MTTPSLPRQWADLKTSDFALLDASKAVAVLPVAATEQHGPHLPLSVDTDLLNGMVASALPNLPAAAQVFFLPTQTVGRSIEHQAFAGTLTVSAASLIQCWVDLGECVARAGLKKLVLLNSHGGNVSTLDIVGRQLRVDFGLTVLTVNTFNLPLPAELISAHEQRFGVHGGEIETSMMLALHTHKVDMSAAQNFASTSPGRVAMPAKLAWAAQDLNSSGAAGNAAAATAEKGLAVLQTTGLGLADVLGEISGQSAQA